MNKSIIMILLLLSISITTYANDKYYSLLGFELEKTNLFEIQKKLGNVPMKHTGDAGGSYYSICYVSKKANVTVYFESGEMGGDEHTLLGFTVKNSLENHQICGNLDTYKTKNNFNIGEIKLGEEIKNIQKLIPLPMKEISNGIKYQTSFQTPFTQEDINRTNVKDMNFAFWDTVVTIKIFANNGIINRFSIYKVTSW